MLSRASMILLLMIVTAGDLPAQAARTSGSWLAPVDITQGVVLNRGAPHPFTASIRAQAARGLGLGDAFRVGPSVAVIYANPDWNVAGGARAAFRLASLQVPMLSRWGIYLQGEQLIGTRDVAPASVALLTDLGLLRFGVQASHDWRSDVRSVETSLGIGLDTLIALLRARPPGEPDFGPPPPP